MALMEVSAGIVWWRPMGRLPRYYHLAASPCAAELSTLESPESPLYFGARPQAEAGGMRECPDCQKLCTQRKGINHATD